MTKQQERQYLAAEDRLLKAAATVLELRGWTCDVISLTRIYDPIRGRHNYDMILRFTGKPPKVRGCQNPEC